MEDSIVYDITEKVSGDELRGTYTESHKEGTFKMVRSQKHDVRK